MAPGDDLDRWVSDVVLADGGTVHVRPIRPSDRDRLVAMHGRLSPQSIYYRYFSPKPRLTDKELERFTTVDFVNRVALVALLGDDLIGVARYDRWPGKDEAEVAFTVDDAHQGRGISTVLLEHLAAIARDRGIVRFTAEVLPDNRPMLGVFRRAGFEVSNAFSGGIIDVAFDIGPTPAFLESVERREQRAESRSIARLLRPRSVAVIGASDRPDSVGRAVLRNLLDGGFDGPIYPVNPTAPHVLSVPSYASVVDIPDDIHLAVVAVPPPSVREVIEQCAAKRVRGVVVITTGFSDQSPEGLAEERELVELGRRNGMRLIGPASMGLIANGPTSSLHATFASAPVLRGTVAISLQSGPLGAGMLELAARMDVGISSFVSLGNKGDVSANDLMNHWEDDPDTTVICLYTESFGNPHKFGRIARRVSRRKPIVAVKANRSGGDDKAADALYQQAGVIRVDTVREMFNVARILSCQPLPAGRRVAVVANAASPAVLALDGLVAAGLEPADLAPATKAALAEQLVPEATVGRAIDLTYRAGPEDYTAALSAVLADEGTDAVLAIYAPPIVNARDAVALAVTEAAAGASKPTVAVVLGSDRGLLVPGGLIPVFEFPEPAVAALGRVVRYTAWRARPLGEVKPLDGVDLVAVREIVERALRARSEGTRLPLRDAQALLGSFGIPFAPARAVTSLQDALLAADELGFPVALKAGGVTRLNRSERGGVALDVQDAGELRGSYERMRSALGPAMAEAVVQQMVPGGVETIVAVQGHPAFGPVVEFGLGGAFADAIADRPARSLPLTDVDAAALVAASRASDALREIDADVAKLEDLLVRVGALVEAVPELARLRLNPVLVGEHGAWVVDAAAQIAPPAASPVDVLVRRLS